MSRKSIGVGAIRPLSAIDYIAVIEYNEEGEKMLPDNIINSEQIRQKLYKGWLLAAKLAEWQGMDVGITCDEENEICAVLINLPSGQVHLVVPAYFMEGKWKELELSAFEDLRQDEQIEAIDNCLNGTLVHKHVLIIPEVKDEIE